MITSTTANLVSFSLECTLFGIFLILSTTSLVLLVRRRATLSGVSPHSGSNGPCTRRGSSWSHRLYLVRIMVKSPLIVSNVLLMLVIPAHWVLSVQRMFTAFVTRGGGQAAIEFFNDLQDRAEVARTALLFICMLIGDAVITYRTWLVWGRNNWVIIVPLLTIATLIAFGIGLLYEFDHASPSKSVFAAAVGRWITGYCGATLCTNLYGTIMIAYRIWSTNRFMRKNHIWASGRDLMQSAMAIFVESAAMYSAWAVMFVIFYATKSALQTIGSGCGPAVIGVAFMLITVRVGLGWGHDSRSVPSEGLGALARSPRRDLGENSFPMRTFTLNVSQTVEQETGYVLRQREVKAPEPAVLGPVEKRTW